MGVGERKSESQDQRRQERYHGRFSRSYRLPNTVDCDVIARVVLWDVAPVHFPYSLPQATDDFAASYRDGVLTITIPT